APAELRGARGAFDGGRRQAVPVEVSAREDRTGEVRLDARHVSRRVWGIHVVQQNRSDMRRRGDLADASEVEQLIGEVGEELLPPLRRPVVLIGGAIRE